MSVLKKLFGLSVAAAGVGLLVLSGCSNAPTPPTAQAPPEAKAPGAPAAPHDGEHAHKGGRFGGIIVPIGSDSYHAEAVFEKGGTLKLYTLGADESKVLEVEAQTLSAFAKEDGGTEAEPFELKAHPQPGDQAGKTSLFAGALPKGVVGKRVEVTVVNLRIGTERFRVGFKSVTETAHAGGTQMPAKLGTEEERQVFLAPGGKYTAADIRANGNTVPSEKYRGIRAAHDDNPKAGEKICPISKTKANPRFTWVVGGKTYEFCCVPCVEEFVVTAKERPAEVLEPEAYVKR
jgi:YHS domain-containing protein